MEKNKILSVERNPARMPKGRIVKSMDYRNFTIWVKRSR